MNNKLLIVCGPTATGKTQLAIELAKTYNGELVSADSRQIYRGMDIGTGKDIEKNTKYQISNTNFSFKNNIYGIPKYDIDGINLWMYDVVDPDEEFSVSHYQTLARSVIEDIRKRGKLPIIVGGTGLYITSLLSPIETSHIPQNKQMRSKLEQSDLVGLQERLQKDDPLAWDNLNDSDRQNPRRLIRKIEIAEYKRDQDFKRLRDKEIKRSGDLEMERQKDKEMNMLILGLTAPYPFLYQRIDRRVEKRVADGVLDEITMLLKKGYTWDLPSMNTFGYKEWKEYFIVPHTSHLIPQAMQRWKYDEHGYARRQMTWFKKMNGICWMDIADAHWRKKVESLVGSWYTS